MEDVRISPGMGRHSRHLMWISHASVTRELVVGQARPAVQPKSTMSTMMDFTLSTLKLPVVWSCAKLLVAVSWILERSKGGSLVLC